MAWTTPRTWAAGALVTADDLNEQVRDNLDVLKTSIDSSGKLKALDSAGVADLSGTNLTGVAKTAGANTYAGKQDFNSGATVRLVLPVGPRKWAT